MRESKTPNWDALRKSWPITDGPPNGPVHKKLSQAINLCIELDEKLTTALQRAEKAEGDREALVKLLEECRDVIKTYSKSGFHDDTIGKINAALSAHGGEQTAEPVAFLKRWRDEQGRVYTTLDWAASEPDGRTPRPLLEFESLPLYAHHALPADTVSVPDTGESIQLKEAREKVIDYLSSHLPPAYWKEAVIENVFSLLQRPFGETPEGRAHKAMLAAKEGK